MKKLKRIFFLALVGVATSSFSQGERKMYFAIGLFTGGHSQMVTFAFISMIGDHFIGAEVVRKERFIYTALGYWPHKINPSHENFFEKHDVDSCFLVKNGNKVAGYYAKPFDDLWKIRFYEHPYEFDQMGWSQGQYTPSMHQEALLFREYGIRNVLTEYIYGDNLFKLLRNVQSLVWVSQYRTASRDTTSGP